MIFANRTQAGRLLADQLLDLRGEDVVVLGLPRGGVVVAFEVAGALGAPLDVVVVRKLGVPSQPELAMGAIGEGGLRVINDEVVRAARVGDRVIASVEAAERAELERRAGIFRGEHPRMPLHGRSAILVDDGIATGSTARVACLVARAQGASRVVLAVPVVAPEVVGQLSVEAELVYLKTPHDLGAVGRWYKDFSQTSDQEVVALLEKAREARARSAR